ncbi:cell adhesion molecule 1-like [Zerene cesonia]|uniref:cell adhesion molecule 1-like n=1 Tax=Zerene cesonia TaxID=33412 RepID=UPI0018E51509|nr:cell adhesion molecule 1-like [Zerene cesonia]
MQWSGLNLVCLALCCFHTASEPLHIEDHVRTRRSDEKDGLALSREIFRNITKKLRESIREGPTDNDHLLQGKVEESRQYAPYQELHHHERHWGPYFEERNITQVTAHVGAEALLNCRVVMLKDKTVMWLRHTTETAQLLTVGPAPYAGDNRVASKFQYPNNWRLSINPVKWSDAGRYMCQISTHPPRTIYTDLTVLPPVLTINGDSTHDVKDKFYKAGSSIKLTCVISDEFVTTLPTKVPMIITTPTTSAPLTTTTEMTTKMSTILNKLDLMLNKSWSVETTTITSTVSISTTTKSVEAKTEVTVQPVTRPVLNNIYGLVWRKQGKDIVNFITWRNMSATFSVSAASQNDSGLYSCHLLNHSQVSINVHVLSGENQAAVHHDTWNKGSLFWQPQILYLLAIVLLSSFFT